jgi:hypothetical protein
VFAPKQKDQKATLVPPWQLRAIDQPPGLGRAFVRPEPSALVPGRFDQEIVPKPLH